MPTNVEEVGLAPPAPHPLDRSSASARAAAGPGGHPATSMMTDNPSSAANANATAAATTTTTTRVPTTIQGQGGGGPGLVPDQCAGCQATGVPLLACDANLEENTNLNGYDQQQQERDRFCPDCMVGKKVRVFWPVDNQWYIGEVQQYDPATGEHLLKYEDEDTEWVRIGESNTTVPVTTPLGAAGAGAGGRTGTPLQQGGREMIDSIPPISPAPGHLMDHRVDSPRTFPSSLMLSGAGPGGPGGLGMLGGVDPAGLLPPGSSAVTPDDKWQSQQEAREQARLNNSSLSSHLQQGYPPSQHLPPPGYSGGPPPPYGSYPPPPPPHGYHSSYSYVGGPPPSHHHHQQPSSHMEDLAPGGVGGPPKHTGFHSLGVRDGTPSPATAAGVGPMSMSSSSVGGGNKRKNGPKAWTKEEDSLLLSIVQSMRMPMKWSVVAQSLPERTGKQCRERYVNHLNPRLKVTDWTPVEDATIFHLYNTIGSHWAKMSKIIPGRTDNGIKNRFHNLRRQLEREDEHRLRLSAARDFPEEIRLDLLREFPEGLRGKSADLWDIKSGLSVLAAQSVLGGGVSRNAGRFGPFKVADDGDVCVRCGFMLPSVQTGTEICTKTGWCQSCARIPPHVTGAMLRECLNLRRCQDEDHRIIIESWQSGKLAGRNGMSASSNEAVAMA